MINNWDDHIKRMDNGSKDNLIEHTNYKKGDIITLNIPEVDRARECVKNGTMHPFSGPMFPESVEEKFRTGITATVTNVYKSKNEIFFILTDGEESGGNQNWFKKVKK